MEVYSAVQNSQGQDHDSQQTYDVQQYQPLEFPSKHRTHQTLAKQWATKNEINQQNDTEFIVF